MEAVECGSISVGSIARFDDEIGESLDEGDYAREYVGNGANQYVEFADLPLPRTTGGSAHERARVFWDSVNFGVPPSSGALSTQSSEGEYDEQVGLGFPAEHHRLSPPIDRDGDPGTQSTSGGESPQPLPNRVKPSCISSLLQPKVLIPAVVFTTAVVVNQVCNFILSGE